MKMSVLKIAIVLCLATGLGFAQNGVKERSLPFGKLAEIEHQGVAAVLDAYTKRINDLNSQERVSKEAFDRVFNEMISDLDLMLEDAFKIQQANSRNSYCDTACSLAQSGKAEICTASTYASAALSACPSSIYAADADYYADACCGFAPFAVTRACAGASQKDDAIVSLSNCRTRSQYAWNNSWYAYSTDGCTDSYDAAVHASNAYVDFHNARSAMYDCY